ncbi:DUF5063 domain-containing protein [uncultured Kordia sp.]|uniref:DUF5063 domain-containing protein n=1 Tax=uncultured Kordia sp. TaxID=507699 RepID=UPI0026110D59|nr:DUF5063 domain-containing protein [uncultured Kordia sp.]
MSELKKIIDDITAFGVHPKVTMTTKHEHLKKLLVRMYSEFLNLNQPEADDTDYGETPDFDYEEIRKNVVSNFPELGWYGTVIEMENIDEKPTLIGDAVDDLADIIKDLLAVKWRFENTSEADAIWYFNFLMYAHTEQHLVDLLKYLKYKFG